MSVQSFTTTVGTAPGLLISDTSTYNVINDGRVSYAIYNAGGSSIYIGEDDVTSGTGFPVPAGATISFDIPTGSKVWAVSTAPASVRILKVA